ncbi:flavodoxin family protein [Amycolatopsis sp. NPDC004368]
MRALIVYEPLSGNTEEVARAVADGLGAADVVPVDEAPHDLSGFDLLVVGAPTHVHGLSRPPKPATAGGTHEPGLREWLAGFQVLPPGTATAAFDIRVGKPHWLSGSAARGAGKAFTRLGHPPVVPAASFFVEPADDGARLRAGELTRARAWGATLARHRHGGAPPG